MLDGGTRVDQVYRQLRSDILGGRIRPGAQLAFAGLKASYGASMGVLREALMRLTAEGLTVAQAQRGFQVVSLSTQDLEDLTETRCMIEGAVLRDSILNGDVEWEARVIAARHRMERTPKFTDDGVTVTSAWSESHQEFHVALLAGAKSKRMQAIAANLRASAEVYRRWSIPFESVPRDVTAEHQEILDLAISRNVDAAVAALTRHLSLTRDLVLNGIEHQKAAAN